MRSCSGTAVISPVSRHSRSGSSSPQSAVFASGAGIPASVLPASGPYSARPFAGVQYVPVSRSRMTSMSRHSAPEFSKVRVCPSTRRS